MLLAKSAKLAVVAVSGIAVIALVVAWMMQKVATDQPARHAPPPLAVLRTRDELPDVALKGRLILTPAQLAQARAAGTLDRPVKSLLVVDKSLQYGEFRWDDQDVPAGPTWIRVDLGTQLMSVFRGENEIGTAVIVYGGDNKKTPTGQLHILARDKNHRSSLYDAPMPYTLQLTPDGVAIHGSNVRWGAATHGCIGIPIEFARRLFNETRVGDEVVIISPGRQQTS